MTLSGNARSPLSVDSVRVLELSRSDIGCHPCISKTVGLDTGGSNVVRICVSGFDLPCLRRYVFEGARRARRRLVSSTQRPTIMAPSDMKAITPTTAMPAMAPVERGLWSDGEGEGVLERVGACKAVCAARTTRDRVGRSVAGTTE